MARRIQTKGGVSHEILGLESLMVALDELPTKMRERVLRDAATEGAKELLPGARASAPVSKKARSGQSGAYRDSLTIKRATIRRKTGDVIAGVALDKKMLFKLGHAQRPSNLPHLLERGHRVVVKTRTGRRLIGETKPRPHLSPALRAASGRCEERVREVIAQRLDHLVRVVLRSPRRST